MKYCVMSDLRLGTKAKRDKLSDDIAMKSSGRKVWGDTIISRGEDEEGYPTYTLEVRFDNAVDMDEVFNFIKSKLDKIPVLKGSVSKHICSHDEANQPCHILESVGK